MIRLERRHLIPILKDREGGGSNKVRDKLDCNVVEAIVLKEGLKEVSINIMKSFLKIKFESPN
jgi:predicted xylose isomerase-like sugar epimerase